MPDLYNAAKPRMYYIGGLVFILLGVLDIWIFYFNPLQVNIFLDQNQNSVKAEQSMIQEGDDKRSE